MDMTLAEFGRYCKEIKPSHFIYLTDDQDRSSDAFMRVVWRCRQMVISLKPDRLCFLNNGNCLSFEAVKFIQVFRSEPCSLTIFKIHCPGKQKDLVYTMMME